MLIKIVNKELEEKRQELIVLEQKQDQLNNAIIKIDDELAFEQKYSLDIEINQFFINYASKAISRKKFFAAEITKLLPLKDKLQDELLEKFQELKRFEKLLSNKEAALELKLAKREEQELDEIRNNKYHQ